MERLQFIFTVEIDQNVLDSLTQQGCDEAMLKKMVLRDVESGWIPQVGHSGLIEDLEVEPMEG